MYSFVDDGTSSSVTAPHSGTYFAALGQAGSVAYLTEDLPTLEGQPYLLSLWLTSPGANNFPNQFVVEWSNGAGGQEVLFNQFNLGAFDWTNLQFVVTGSGNISTLAIGFQNDPDYFGLDDVSVVPISWPRLAGTVLGGTTFKLTWNTTTGLVYQVQYKTDLGQLTWSNLDAHITATASTATASDTIVRGAARFYRVVLVP